MERNDIAAAQYKTPDSLKTRMEFQGRYSTNRYGFNQWLLDQYAFPKDARVLDIGCGTGGMWKGQEALVSGFAEWVLTDFSEGMLAEAQRTLAGLPRAQYRRADICELPFPDGAFDYVIANMMLYHVDDKRKALREVRRVLAPGGTFACATYGEVGVPSYTREVLDGVAEIHMPDTSFTLQNGMSLLRETFGSVQRRLYPDSFEVDDADDLIRYLLSMSQWLTGDPDRFPVTAVKTALEKRMAQEGGKLHIPKEYGTFLAQ